MSSTYAESLRTAIQEDDSEAVVALLEPRVSDGTATEGEALLCGVLLLMPPLADYEAAAIVFRGQLKGERRFEGAVWDAYRFAVLLPDGDRSFEGALHSMPQSAVSAHMLSLVAGACGDMDLALNENRRSRALRLFPFNIIEALKQEPGLDASARGELWRNACDLMVSRRAESDAAVSTIEGALQRRWDNLILGTRVTGPLWDSYCERFGRP
jgi:hypothetical protein